jgi:hypothetical protein
MHLLKNPKLKIMGPQEEEALVRAGIPLANCPDGRGKYIAPRPPGQPESGALVIGLAHEDGANRSYGQQAVSTPVVHSVPTQDKEWWAGMVAALQEHALREGPLRPDEVIDPLMTTNPYYSVRDPLDFPSLGFDQVARDPRTRSADGGDILWSGALFSEAAGMMPAPAPHQGRNPSSIQQGPRSTYRHPSQAPERGQLGRSRGM